MSETQRLMITSLALDDGRITGYTSDVLVAADLPDSGVTAGSYALATVTVDAYGRITAIAAGTVDTITQATLGDVVFTLQSTASNDGPKEIVRQGKTTTTNNTPATALTIPLDEGAACLVVANVTGHRTGGSAGSADDSYIGVLTSGFRRSSGGSVTFITGVNSVTKTVERRDNGSVTSTLDVSGGDILVTVTGDTNNDYSWVVTARIYPLST